MMTHKKQHFKNWIGIILGVVTCLLVACQQDIISSDPSLRLHFSHDTVLFDTVFTTMGTSTRRVMIYNPNKHAINISQVSMENGEYFHINLDGENDLDKLHNVVIRGEDSSFLFIRAHIDPLAENSPVFIEDHIAFLVNDHSHQITLQAYGQNVEKIKSDSGLVVYKNLTLSNKKPYIIYDTLVIAGSLKIEEGTTIYMHEGASIYAYGNVRAMGTKEQPIIIRGDRTDQLFDSVPYRMASGQWNGLYLVSNEEFMPPSYNLEYVEILSGSVGLYAYSTSIVRRPKLTMKNSRIHNHSIYGLVLQNVDATISNCEISNCASYCVYLAGGKHNFVHNTIAAYYGYPYTNLNIHGNIIPEDVAAVYINDLSKNYAKTNSSFSNCIITGGRKNNVVVATPLEEHYTGEFVGNYLRADSLSELFAHNNVYATEEDTTVFRNIYYQYKKYHYYDFRLDSLSPARGIADSTIALSYPTDRIGNTRKPHPDAGCYEYIEQ